MTEKHATIATRIKALQQMSVTELRREYRQVYGEETSACHKGFLLKRVAWRIQELEFGGVSEEIQQKALEIVEELDLPGKIPSSGLPKARSAVPAGDLRDKRLPMPGTLLTREYKGKQVNLEVLEKGFSYEGRSYRSLSAVAKAVTGSHINGFSFFNLQKRKGA